MNFKENLQKLSDKIDDLMGVAIAGMDGILVEEIRVDPSFDLGPIAAEYGGLWRSVDQAGQSVELGAGQEMTVMTEKAIILVKKINRDYFLVLVAGSEKNFGKGRFLLKMEAASLVEEFS